MHLLLSVGTPNQLIGRIWVAHTNGSHAAGGLWRRHVMGCPSMETPVAPPLAGSGVWGGVMVDAVAGSVARVARV